MDAVSYSHSAKQSKRIKKFIENPDSTSGVVTVPSTIATGETITIPAGRTAILPDVLVEGDLLVEGTVFIPTGSTYTQETIKTEAISNVAGSTTVNVIDIVSKVGNQTIGGTKTFLTSPIVPTPTAGDNSTKVATTAFSTDQALGVNTSYIDMSASRFAGVTYTNSSSKPRFIKIYSLATTSDTDWDLFVDGLRIDKYKNGATNTKRAQLNAVVPPNSTYSLVVVLNSVTFVWHEL